MFIIKEVVLLGKEFKLLLYVIAHSVAKMQPTTI